MKRLLREPLVHFLALGGLLFLFFSWRGGGSGASNRIVLTPGEIDSLVTGFTRTWQRPPSEAELKGLIDERVKEEIAVREATAMGLDRDDTVIRRRLRQKVEFLAEEAAAAAPPTDAEVRAWLAAHPGAIAPEPRVSFRQVFVSVDRRGRDARAEAARVLERLRKAGPSAATDALGDATMLPAEMPSATFREVGQTFGEELARALPALEPGLWSGPVASTYGLHLVLVRERVAGEQPDLATVRPMVERELVAERKKAELDAFYARLLEKYPVVVEKRKAGAPEPPAGAAR